MARLNERDERDYSGRNFKLLLWFVCFSVLGICLSHGVLTLEAQTVLSIISLLVYYANESCASMDM